MADQTALIQVNISNNQKVTNAVRPPSQGELVYNPDTDALKIGDGNTAYAGRPKLLMSSDFASESDVTGSDLPSDKILTPGVTPALFNHFIIPHRPPHDIIGVVDTGERGPSGGGLQLVDLDGNPLVGYGKPFFDGMYPWAGMKDYMAGVNNMVKVPIFYTLRDTQPEGKPFAGNPRWMISPEAFEGFAADGRVFKDSAGNWKNEVLIGKYRALNSSNVAVSTPTTDGKRWGNVDFNTLKTACQANGSGYHLMSYQEHCALLWLALVEKQTWNLYPEAARGDPSFCRYRGVEEFCYDGPEYIARDTAGRIWCEWQDGLRTNAQNQLEMFNEDGSRTYVNTGITAASNNFIQTLLSGAFDKYFIAASVGSEATSLIPDYTYTAASCVCNSDFASGHAANGAFRAYLLRPASGSVHPAIGGRLAKGISWRNT
jgi:hypothetical protein